jgi:hypothetical protein
MLARALGEETAEMPEDDMGNLVVTGDIYGADAADILRALGDGTAVETPQPEPQPASPSQVEPQRRQPRHRWAAALGKAALLSAGLLGGSGIGVVVPWLMGAFDKHGDTTIVRPDEDRLNVEVVPGGATE